MAAKIINFQEHLAKRLASRDWSEEVDKLKRRIERIVALKAGSADVKTVRVKQVRVRAHTRRAHTRVVITLRQHPRPATKKGQ